VADLLGKAHLVGHAHHRHAFLGQLHHHVQHLAHHLGVERAGGLVEQHHDRVHAQRAGDGHALLLAARELAGELVLVRHQAHAVEHLQAALGVVLVAAQHLDLRQRQVLGHAQVREQLEVLEHHAHAAAQLGQVGLGVAMLMPSTTMSPFWKGSSALTVLISVDLPEPDGPQTTTTSPFWMVVVQSVSTWKLPYHLETFLMSIMAHKTDAASCGDAVELALPPNG
jgi:hypothetical protein